MMAYVITRAVENAGPSKKGKSTSRKRAASRSATR
ncbi:TPA: hypothetical protein ACGI14_002747 [Corynebacterium striatum]